MRIRIEQDELGTKEIPLEAYYGIHTLRGKENFQITKQPISRQMIKGLALVKKACARANADAGLIDDKIANAISLSCDELINGRLHGQFITDVIQGGAGISMNMNANEVIANRANEMLGGTKGKYEFVDPFTHVNCGQSTNDVIPTAGKIACIRMAKKLTVELKKMQNTLTDKAKAWEHVLKSSRTHLNTSSPTTLGRTFEAYATTIGQDISTIEDALVSFYEVNIGATLNGSGINAHPKYIKKFIYHINKLTGENYETAKNLDAATSSPTCFLVLSSALKALSIHLMKIANDLRILASDSINELTLPHLQSGSSMAPGKNHPVIPEMVNQVAFYCLGQDTTITYAFSQSELDFNVYLPIILSALFESLTLTRRSVRTFRESCLSNIQYNPQVCQPIKDDDYLTFLYLMPKLGYKTLLNVFKKSQEQGKPANQVLIDEGLMTQEQLNQIAIDQ